MTHRGEAMGGMVMVKLNQLDLGCRVLTQQRGLDGNLGWLAAFENRLVPEAEADAYIARAVKRDPDVWVVEVEDRAGRHLFDGQDALTPTSVALMRPRGPQAQRGGGRVGVAVFPPCSRGRSANHVSPHRAALPIEYAATPTPARPLKAQADQRIGLQGAGRRGGALLQE